MTVLIFCGRHPRVGLFTIVQRLEEGDENSKLYHRAIKYREMKNTLKGLNVNSQWTEDPNIIKNHVFEFFKDKFSSTRKERPRLISGKFKKISRDEVLERPFEEEEIWNAIKEYGSNKSPGADSFTFGFVKRYWETIKTDLKAALQRFGRKKRLVGVGFSNF